MVDPIWVVMFILLVAIVGLGLTLDKVSRELNELKAK